MSLDWSIKKVKNWEQISMGKENGPEGWKTNRLVWLTMEVCMGSITKENVDEFWRRLEPLQEENPPFDDRALLTKDDLVRRIGLWTNASTFPAREYDAMVTKRKTAKKSSLP